MLKGGKYSILYDSVVALTKRFDSARKTAAKNIRGGNRTVKFPYKHKLSVALPLKRDAFLKTADGHLKISVGKDRHLDFEKINIPNIRSGQLKYSRGNYYLCYNILCTEPENNVPAVKKAGIDIGEVNCIGFCSEDGTAFTVSNGPAQILKRKRNQAYGYFYGLLKKCRAGSNRFSKITNAKYKIQEHTYNSLKDFYHKVTHSVIKYCIDNNIGELIIGNLRGINSAYTNVSYKLTRIRLSQMEYSTIKKYIKDKAQKSGIKVTFVNEYYTTQTCPQCNEKSKPRPDRVYACSRCGLHADRDIVGAFNNLKKKYDIIFQGFNVIECPVNIQEWGWSPPK